MKKLADDTINNIIELRKSGYSYKEISKELDRGTGSVYKYSRKIELTNKAKKTVRIENFN